MTSTLNILFCCYIVIIIPWPPDGWNEYDERNYILYSELFYVFIFDCHHFNMKYSTLRQIIRISKAMSEIVIDDDNGEWVINKRKSGEERFRCGTFNEENKN